MFKIVFLEPPVSSYVGDGVRRLHHPATFTITSDTTDQEHTFTIPKRFVWDGASIPKFAYSLIGGPYSGNYYKAALIHDYFYRTGCVPRHYADDVFYEKMRADGVGRFKAWIIYKSVRLFGGSAYKGGK